MVSESIGPGSNLGPAPWGDSSLSNSDEEKRKEKQKYAPKAEAASAPLDPRSPLAKLPANPTAWKRLFFQTFPTKINLFYAIMHTYY